MMKTALFVPYEEMLPLADKVIKEQGFSVEYRKAIQTVDAVNEARLAVAAGVRIIIARGYQAKLIKEYTNIPLVEMKFHAQEIGLLLQKAKRLVKKETPVVGLVLFDNMLCDLTHMEELFSVQLLISCMDRIEDAPRILETMAKKNLDIVIGGKRVCGTAEAMGYPTILYESTEESMKEAFRLAKQMAFAMETEQQNTAQFETVLDTSFNGIVKVNTACNIIVINKIIENLIGKSAEEVTGMPLKEVLPQFDYDLIQSVLEGRREDSSTSVNIFGDAGMLMAAPIQYDNHITGAILSLRKITELPEKSRGYAENSRMHGFSAETYFEDIETENERMKQTIAMAKVYSLSESPVLIYGGIGTEYRKVAEAIHNNSLRKQGPFVSIDIRSIDKDKQVEALFGTDDELVSPEMRRRGAVIRANYGTILIEGIECLTKRNQYLLYRTMRPEEWKKTDAVSADNLDVRILACAHENLLNLTKKGQFSEELFFQIQGLNLEIPKLADRKEDLLRLFNRFMTEYCDHYNKRLKITQGGYEKLKNLPWEGNEIQLKSFCERLVLNAKRRSVGEVEIAGLYTQLYPFICEVEKKCRVVIYKSQEAVELAELLKKHAGNRNQAAKELGISTTTLWRRMKKYGIETDYGVKS